MKLFIFAIILAVVIIALILIGGCATFEADIKGEDIHLKSATFGKDVIIDPNGVMSTVSPKNQGIIEAVAGFIAGILVMM